MIDYFFSGFRWYRKLQGGEWQQWFIDIPVCSNMWFHNLNGKRPALAVGLLAIEDYNPKYHTKIYE